MAGAASRHAAAVGTAATVTTPAEARRVTESIKHWGDELQIAHSRGVGVCPATTLIDDPQILSDKQLQDQLFKNPQRTTAVWWWHPEPGAGSQ